MRSARHIRLFQSVLIDTWWNVNTESVADDGVTVTVLIDTWWNVNLFTAIF